VSQNKETAASALLSSHQLRAEPRLTALVTWNPAIAAAHAGKSVTFVAVVSDRGRYVVVTTDPMTARACYPCSCAYLMGCTTK
jgi:hypothetical protein